ncbi:MAG: MOSC domain-containing protein [Gammaproteobacteria bacterium]
MSEPVVACLLVAAQRHGEVQVLPAVQVKAGCGIVGDRFFSRSSRHPERNITLIEAEAIEAVAAELALPIPVTAPRRNVVTRGIRLNALMGKTFTIGPVTLQGIELCEPCVVLGRQLETATCPRDIIIRAFLRRGGLRATIVTSGVIREGDVIRI